MNLEVEVDGGSDIVSLPEDTELPSWAQDQSQEPPESEALALALPSHPGSGTCARL